MKNTFNTHLAPFNGYYGETLEASILEDRLEISEQDGQEPRDVSQEEYRATATQLAKDYVIAFESIASEFLTAHNATIAFESISFPKYYNYTTDHIWLDVTGDFTDDDDFQSKLASWTENYNETNYNPLDMAIYYELTE